MSGFSTDTSNTCVILGLLGLSSCLIIDKVPLLPSQDCGATQVFPRPPPASACNRETFHNREEIPDFMTNYLELPSGPTVPRSSTPSSRSPTRAPTSTNTTRNSTSSVLTGTSTPRPLPWRLRLDSKRSGRRRRPPRRPGSCRRTQFLRLRHGGPSIGYVGNARPGPR